VRVDEPFIRYVDLHKSFGTKVVLDGVDLDVRRGETVVVLGGSGSGKSVLLRHTIGLHRPDSGQVFVDGEEITGLEERDLTRIRRKVGMLFQASALFDSMDVYENVAFGLRESTDMTEEGIAARVREKLALVELDEVENLLPSDLSGGMRKRVALARAIAMEPQGLLYDEPTTGLDPITAGTINHLIRSLQRALGVTSIVVTHDIQSAFTVGDRIAFLHDGRLLFTGGVKEAQESDERRLRAFLDGAWAVGGPR
jgi:phospholipid/cholesterol/gamma-HCH transport system ATP-binding protein